MELTTPSTTPNNPDPLLTVEECAAWLNVSPGFVRQRIADRTIPVRRFGRTVRVHLSALKAYTEAQ